MTKNSFLHLYCRYGAINTGVIFNNSLGGGRQRDLLIKLPFEEAWPGMFELTVEVWHDANPERIPQIQPQSKKGDDKSILETLFDTLATQLTKTVNDFETKRAKENDELLKTEITTVEPILETTTLTVEDTTIVEEEITTIAPNEENEKLSIIEENQKKDRLIMRMEREHMIYAGR